MRFGYQIVGVSILVLTLIIGCGAPRTTDTTTTPTKVMNPKGKDRGMGPTVEDFPPPPPLK